MSEAAFHHLADGWLSSVEEALEGLDDYVEDLDVSNAVRLVGVAASNSAPTRLPPSARSKAC